MLWPFSKKESPHAFSKVPSSDVLPSYAGNLPNSPESVHRLYSRRIKPELSLDLVERRTAVLGGKRPTHAIICVFKLGEETRYRTLFCLFVAVDRAQDNQILPEPLADAIVAKTVRYLANWLKKCDRCWLIRCRNDREFPWCVENDVLTEYWSMQTDAYLRMLFRDTFEG